MSCNCTHVRTTQVPNSAPYSFVFQCNVVQLFRPESTRKIKSGCANGCFDIIITCYIMQLDSSGSFRNLLGPMFNDMMNEQCSS